MVFLDGDIITMEKRSNKTKKNSITYKLNSKTNREKNMNLIGSLLEH